MHIKFLAHGQGSGRKAATYLLGEKDSKGEIRAGIDVLRGDPLALGDLIDSLSTVNRYTSGVVAWHPDDKPTPEQIEKFVDDLEAAAFAGLEPQQYTWCVVQHLEANGAVHLHFIAARVELESGRAMNIAPPGWEGVFYPLRDAWNAENGWARPDDPALKRDVQPGGSASAPAWRAGTDPKQVITDWLADQVVAGHIQDREGVVNALRGIGEITRQGRDYLSVRLEGETKPLRLKGEIYDEQFDAAAIAVRATAAAAASGPSGPGSPNPSDAAAARARLAKAVGKRAAYNRQRYPALRPEPGAAARELAEADAPPAYVAPRRSSGAEHFDGPGSLGLERLDDPGREHAGPSNLPEVSHDPTNPDDGAAAYRCIEASFRAANAANTAVIAACDAARGSEQAAVRAGRAAVGAGEGAVRAGGRLAALRSRVKALGTRILSAISKPPKPGKPSPLRP